MSCEHTLLSSLISISFLTPQSQVQGEMNDLKMKCAKTSKDVAITLRLLWDSHNIEKLWEKWRKKGEINHHFWKKKIFFWKIRFFDFEMMFCAMNQWSSDSEFKKYVACTLTFDLCELIEKLKLHGWSWNTNPQGLMNSSRQHWLKWTQDLCATRNRQKWSAMSLLRIVRVLDSPRNLTKLENWFCMAIFFEFQNNCTIVTVLNCNGIQCGYMEDKKIVNSKRSKSKSPEWTLIVKTLLRVLGCWRFSDAQSKLSIRKELQSEKNFKGIFWGFHEEQIKRARHLSRKTTCNFLPHLVAHTGNSIEKKHKKTQKQPTKICRTQTEQQIRTFHEQQSYTCCSM